jgi:tetratricopeptide (TPR) repeat protein
MADNQASKLPAPSAEHRGIAAQQFDRANHVIATGNYDYGIQLLMTCCKLDPANLIYRKALRLTEKTKFKNNLKGSSFAFLSNSACKAKMKAAKGARDFLKVLEYGEEALARNPWDTGVQLDMATAADALGEINLAVWIMEQARHKDPKDTVVNKRLAGLYEKRGNYTQAINLWELVRQAKPQDDEARQKAHDLAATDTIARGGYAGNAPAPAKDVEEASEPFVDTSPQADMPSTPAEPPPSEVTVLQKRIDEDPTNVHAYLRLGGFHRRAGNLELAQKTLQLGLGPTANHFELVLELAEIDIEMLRQDLVLAEAKLRAQPTNEGARETRTRLLKEINSREMELYRQKADRYPTNKAYRFELGVRLLRAGQVEEAIGELQGLRSDPRYQWRALMYLGLCFKHHQNWRLAQRNFEEALEHLPPDELTMRKEILFQLAQGNAEAGEFSKAVGCASALCELDQRFRNISQMRSEWQARLTKPEVS